uniref:Protein UL34 n=1 Tax=Lemniscomys rat herpesvirus TaxID=3141920 RepID=A0AAU7E2F3_9VIRU
MIITTSPAPREPLCVHRQTRECSRESAPTVDGFIKSIHRFYRTLNRAEDRKRFLACQLPTCIKVRSTTSSFMFYNSTDNERLENEVTSVKKNPRSLDPIRIDRVLHGIKCRVRKKPFSPTLSPTQISIIRAVRNISVAFNRITYIARIKHYCDRESRISNYLRDQLTKRCSESSKLSSGIRRLLMCIGIAEHRDLSTVLVGILCQTPHMWARSIRLLVRLKVFCQNLFIKMFNEFGIDLRDVFELSYHTASQRLLLRVKQYGASVFTLNQNPRDCVAVDVRHLTSDEPIEYRPRQEFAVEPAIPPESPNEDLPSPPPTPFIREDDDRDPCAADRETTVSDLPVTLPTFSYIIFNDTLLTADGEDADAHARPGYISVSLSPQSPNRDEPDTPTGITIRTSF